MPSANFVRKSNVILSIQQLHYLKLNSRIVPLLSVIGVGQNKPQKFHISPTEEYHWNSPKHIKRMRTQTGPGIRNT